MSDAIARRNRDLGDFISGSPLSGYRARFAGHFLLERDDGVLTIRVHRGGQAARWSRGLLNAWNLLLAEAGADRDNELVIITGTGDPWLAGADPRSFAEPVPQWDSDLIDEQYNDGVKVLERLVFDIDVPTIAVINGPGPRLELPLLCDLTLCAPDVVFGDGNFLAGSVPGDGMFLVLRELAASSARAISSTPARESPLRKPSAWVSSTRSYRARNCCPAPSTSPPRLWPGPAPPAA